MSVRFTNNPQKAEASTHAGKWHADETLGATLLGRVYGDITVYRCPASTVDIENLNPNAILFDFGHGKFDHHNVTPSVSRVPNDASKDPVPYSSLGLLWKEFGPSLCSRFSNNNPEIAEKIWNYVEEKLVLGVDAADNGIYPQTPLEYAKYNVLTTPFLISLLNPNDMSSESLEEALKKTIEYAEFVFDICIQQAIAYAYGSHPVPVEKFFTAEQIFVQALEIKFSTVGLYRKRSYYKSFSRLPRRSKGNYFSIPYSRVGNLWEQEGRRFCNMLDVTDPNFIWNYINTHLIIGVDAIANNIRPSSPSSYSEYPIWTLYDFIEELNPISLRDVANARKKAIEIATLVIDRLIEKAKYHLSSRQYIEEKMNEENFKAEHKNILVFEKHVHWRNWLLHDENSNDIFFVISPSATGGYIVQPVPNGNKGFRVAFPNEWHGLYGKDLEDITKVQDVSFVHHADGFIAGAKSLNSAIELAQKSISISKNS